MKNNLKIWMVILGIVVSGLLITSFTSLYVSKQREKLNIRPMTASFSASSAAQDAGAGRTALSDKADTAARPGVQSSRTAAPGEAAAGGEAGTGGAEAARTADEGPAGLAPASAMPEMALAETEAEAAEAFAEAEAVPGAAPGEGADSGAEKEGAAAEAASAPLTSGAGAAADGSGSEDSAEDSAASESVSATEAPKVKLYAVPEESTAETEDYHVLLAGYETRLPELDSEIERLRSSQTENTVYSVKNMAETELRIWDRELNDVYKILMDSLDEADAELLRKEEREWIKKRDEKAQAAARKYSGGSMESVEYSASLAASTRDRVYVLVETYK